MAEYRSPEESLAAISEVFYNNDNTDRIVCGAIGYLLAEAGYGPHARKIAGGSPLLPRAHELEANGNVWWESQWWQAHRADDGRVYRATGHGNWILPPQNTQDTYRPWSKI
jgi:hypothetical protein